MHRRQFLQLGALGLAALHFPAFARTGTHTGLTLPAALKNNPLLDFSGLPRFADIRPQHINPAVDFLLAHNRRTVATLTAIKQPNWQNFYLPLADAGDLLGRAWGAVSHLMSVNNSEALRRAHATAQGKISAFQTWYGLHQGLYNSFRALHAHPESARYTQAQKKALDDALLDFKLSGIALNPTQQKRYADINTRLDKLRTQFSNNVLDAVAAWEKIITDEAQLSGLSDTARQAARASAQSKGQEGWRFTLDYPSYSAIALYSDRPELRRECYQAYATRASDQGPHARKWDNGSVMRDILNLRLQKAKLLGFKTYADYALATRMADNPKQVMDFLQDLLAKSRPQAQREIQALQDYAAKQHGITQLEAWDAAYYAEKLKTERYAVNSEALRPYFPADKVLAGLFETAKRLFGISVIERQDVQVWHPTVRFFHVLDENKQHIASFYLDLYAREGKRGGAWMNGLIDRRRDSHGTLHLPVAVLVLNCSAPADHTSPALLTHDEATTLFHEFGHALHHMLTVIEVAAVSGINGVPWDAVEFPSQMLEGWTWDKQALKLISAHHQTGEPLPEAMLDKMLASKNFQAARALVRQIEFALFDFILHTRTTPVSVGDILAVAAQVRRQAAVLPEPEWVRRGHSFSHIFAGGYAAGYYGYLWSEVLAADAFGRFEQSGLFNRTIGREFVDKLLSQGGSQAPMRLFEHFMGRAPQSEALLQQRGIKP
ncbi:M3 family metallopeptidase [Conchiformibius steedae DSM 2580]|uniref:oligopeptidase A n=1 Tax=Conchiformibius steedae DSM 2580 TaxID=1121352 RepID=A0AAE9HUW7_9NEIS|nr:M3 family metallopeptidase [Conchiformibius steedae]QMT33906.1 M3 family metallopeptidase [Conchiformibius steedae]URD66675.1 M3 family metallopeptidase [Conchiformibius steedae DSM 2580]